MITVDWNFGVMNHGHEKNHEPRAAMMMTISSGFLHLYKKITRLPESKSSFLFISFIIGSRSNNFQNYCFLMKPQKEKILEERKRVNGLHGGSEAWISG
jgi:hypothetical protein